MVYTIHKRGDLGDGLLLFEPHSIMVWSKF